MNFTLPIEEALALKVHPVADLFPMLPPDEAAELAVDVDHFGLREAITLYQGEVLDGRNRLKACRDAGVPPVFETYEGDDPVAFIISRNIRRRQLSPGQRAMIAAEIARLGVGRPKAAVPEDVPERDAGLAENGAHGPDFSSIGEAAAQMDVGARSVKRAKVVREAGSPALVKAVEDGAVSLRAAERLARSISVEEQEELAAQGVEALTERAERLARAAVKAATPKAGEVLAALAMQAQEADGSFAIDLDRVNACRGQVPEIFVDHQAGLVRVTV